MKKTTFLFFTMLLSFGIFAQDLRIVEQTIKKNSTGQKLVDPEVEITLGEITTTTVSVSFAPNETCDSYYIYITTAEGMNMWIGMFGSERGVVRQFGIQKSGDYTHFWTSLDGGTEYTIYASPSNTTEDIFPMQTIVFSTLNGGGTGLAEIDVQVSEITETSARVVATPNDQTAVFYDGLITVELYNELGADSVNNFFKTEQALYATDNWVWGALTSGTAYYALAFGKNANDEWGSTNLVEFTTLTPTNILNCEKQQSEISIFPNPSKGKFTFKTLGEKNGKIVIYNLNGQKVLEQMISGSENIINTNELANGVYQVVFNEENSFETASQKLIINK